MCSLIVLREARPFDVAIGMNRDEAYGRRFRGPRLGPGGEFYAPMWDGVIAAPSDADEPKTRLDRALAQKRTE